MTPWGGAAPIPYPPQEVLISPIGGDSTFYPPPTPFPTVRMKLLVREACQFAQPHQTQTASLRPSPIPSWVQSAMSLPSGRTDTVVAMAFACLSSFTFRSLFTIPRSPFCLDFQLVDVESSLWWVATVLPSVCLRVCTLSHPSGPPFWLRCLKTQLYTTVFSFYTSFWNKFSLTIFYVRIQLVINLKTDCEH